MDDQHSPGKLQATQIGHLVQLDPGDFVLLYEHYLDLHLADHYTTLEA